MVLVVRYYHWPSGSQVSHVRIERRGLHLRETFATNLRRLRNAKGWSQDELARDQRSYLSQLQKGVYYVSIKVIGRLADKLDVEPDEFLKRTAKRDRAK